MGRTVKRPFVQGEDHFVLHGPLCPLRSNRVKNKNMADTVEMSDCAVRLAELMPVSALEVEYLLLVTNYGNNT